MDYPREFSNKARAAVEAELIRAGRLHEERKRNWQSEEWSFPERNSLATYLLSVFLTYAQEAIELGKSGIWAVDRVREEALEGLRLITLRISHQKQYSSFIEYSGFHITPQALREFEDTDEWHQFEDDLLALAEGKAPTTRQQRTPVATNPESAPGTTTNPPSWKSLQAEFLQYADEHADLSAVWTWAFTEADQDAQRSLQGQWTFGGGSRSSQHLFKQIVRRVTGFVPGWSGTEPWLRWLDLMREEGYARKVLPKRVPWFLFKTEANSGAHPLPPGYESQQIEDVFKSSADFCSVHSLAGSSAPHLALAGAEIIWGTVEIKEESDPTGERSRELESTAPEIETDLEGDHQLLGVADDRQKSLSATRKAIVEPILASKGWTRGMWATVAGVGKNSVYEYLEGKRGLSPQNRRAMAEVLGLRPDELPE